MSKQIPNGRHFLFNHETTRQNPEFTSNVLNLSNESSAQRSCSAAITRDRAIAACSPTPAQNERPPLPHSGASSRAAGSQDSRQRGSNRRASFAVDIEAFQAKVEFVVADFQATVDGCERRAPVRSIPNPG